jgi:hypothetical protein
MQGLKPIHEVRLEPAAPDRTWASAVPDSARVLRGPVPDARAQRRTARRAAATAREIDERHEEKLLALGPVLERTNDELLDPIVDRAFALMEAAGLIPPPPRSCDGVEAEGRIHLDPGAGAEAGRRRSQDRFLQASSNVPAAAVP